MIAEAMPLATKLLFIVVGLGLLAVPIGLAHWQKQRSYDRTRNTKIKPVGMHRYNRLWVVDPDRTDDDKGITV
jgi:hypothetical protein